MKISFFQGKCRSTVPEVAVMATTFILEISSSLSGAATLLLLAPHSSAALEMGIVVFLPAHRGLILSSDLSHEAHVVT